MAELCLVTRCEVEELMIDDWLGVSYPLKVIRERKPLYAPQRDFRLCDASTRKSTSLLTSLHPNPFYRTTTIPKQYHHHWDHSSAKCLLRHIAASAAPSPPPRVAPPSGTPSPAAHQIPLPPSCTARPRAPRTMARLGGLLLRPHL